MKLEKKNNKKSEKPPLQCKIFLTAYRINNACEPLIFNLNIHPYIPPQRERVQTGAHDRE